MTKAEARRYFQEKRKVLSTDEIETKSRQICWLFFSTFDLSLVRYLHIFLPIARFKEINTWLIIHRIKELYPAVSIVFPKIKLEDSSMESYAYDQHLVVAENNWGITEPVQGTRIESHQIDMILVPLLGFDKNGFRVGYGKGFYDRFLATCRKEIPITGLCIEEPIAKIEDVNKYDIPMNFCITPTKIWQFGRE